MSLGQGSLKSVSLKLVFTAAALTIFALYAASDKEKVKAPKIPETKTTEEYIDPCEESWKMERKVDKLTGKEFLDIVVTIPEGCNIGPSN